MTTPGPQAPATAQPRPQDTPGAGREIPHRRYGLEIIVVAALIALIGTGAAAASSSATSNRAEAATTQISPSSVAWPVAGSPAYQGLEMP